MANSRNTAPENLQAKWGVARTSDGKLRLPPIIVRKPRRGDLHPISKSHLERLLLSARTEYLYGLKRIELRSRIGNTVGEPFAYYYPVERTVVLYSLPLVWELSKLSGGWERLFTDYLARVDRGSMISVSWPDRSILGLWFWDQVVMHELGHHFVEQYRSKNGRVRSRNAHERLAEMHVGRYLSRRYQRLKQLVAQSAASKPSKHTEPCGKRGAADKTGS